MPLGYKDRNGQGCRACCPNLWCTCRSQCPFPVIPNEVRNDNPRRSGSGPEELPGHGEVGGDEAVTGHMGVQFDAGTRAAQQVRQAARVVARHDRVQFAGGDEHAPAAPGRAGPQARSPPSGAAARRRPAIPGAAGAGWRRCLRHWRPRRRSTAPDRTGTVLPLRRGNPPARGCG